MKQCIECEHYKPLYHELGKCRRPYIPGAKIFVDDEDAAIMVHATFGCNQFTEITPNSDATI